MVESLRGVGELVVLRELLGVVHSCRVCLSLPRMTSSLFVLLRAICAGHSPVSRSAESLCGVGELVLLRTIWASYS